MRIVTNEENATAILKSEVAVSACSIILTACCKAFQRKINHFRTSLSYNIGISCCQSENPSHSLLCDDEPSLCVLCQEDKPENYFRHCWMNAAKKVRLIFLPDKLTLFIFLVLQDTKRKRFVYW